MVHRERKYGQKYLNRLLFLLVAVTFVLSLSCTSEPGGSSELEVAPTHTPIPTVPKDVGGCDLDSESEVDCPGANFDGQDLSEISVGHVGASEGREGADFSDANIEGASFVGSNLEGVFFEGANVRGANFQDANLRGASFYKADLTGSDFTGATLENADFEDAILEDVIYCRTKMIDGRMSDRDCP